MKDALIAVLPGDGIGPEVTEQAVNVLKAIQSKIGHTFRFEYADVGAVAIDHFGNPYPESTHELCKNADAILFGAIGDPKYDNDPNAKVRPEQGLLKMRKELGLYANLRPVKAYESLLELSPLKADRIHGVDFLVIRELTGGIYFGEKTLSSDGQRASDLCAYEVYEIDRIAKMAFQIAEGRTQKLTLVDKANVLETSRLWRRRVSELAENYPSIKLDFLFVDNAAMQLITAPQQFDVILTENMFGDILTDEASVITGSLGMLPSASLGDMYKLFEPIHGSYPQATGKNIANPIAAILSAAMLLDLGLDLHEEAQVVRDAVQKVIDAGNLTADIGQGRATTQEVGRRVVDALEK